MPQTEINNMIDMLEKLMQPHFLRLEQKLDSMHEELIHNCENNQRKFQELYDSRNAHEKEITKLKTTGATLYGVLLLVVALLEFVPWG